ncbi:hypothetical protein Tco_1572120, partial [Tanacetum coccineum]
GLRLDLMWTWSLLKQCSYIMSTKLPRSMHNLPPLYVAIIAVMTTGSDDGIKVSHGRLRDGICD